MFQNIVSGSSTICVSLSVDQSPESVDFANFDFIGGSQDLQFANFDCGALQSFCPDPEILSPGLSCVVCTK